MSDRMLHEFRDRAENLVVLPDLEALQNRGTALRRTRVAVGATIVASLVAVIGVVVTGSLGDDRAVGPATAEAQRTARAFLLDYSSFDAEKVLGHLTSEGVTDSFGTEGALRRELAYHEATGYKQSIEDCDVTSRVGTEVRLRCPFELETLRSDEVGLAPFGQNYWELTVQDGSIVKAVYEWPFSTNGFADLVWEPFALWVERTYPQDAEVMYTDFTLSLMRTTPEATRLWERRNKEYAALATDDPTQYLDRPAVASYVSQLGSLCEAADRELGARSGAAGTQAYVDAARLVSARTLRELRPLKAPESVRLAYEVRAFGLMQQFAEGIEGSDHEAWVREVEQYPGLRRCTFDLPR